jgi:hypothetical protein
MDLTPSRIASSHPGLRWLPDKKLQRPLLLLKVKKRMHRTMQNEQEDTLRNFMSHSFGSPCLYLPHKIKKGNADREPADLIWANDSFVARFYLKRNSKKSFNKQNDGNFRQADGYRRFWKTNDPNWLLRGTNSDGYSCAISYASVTHHLIVSVVSKRCGLTAQKLSEEHPNELRITVPEEFFLLWLSSFNGTIVDLLSITKGYLKRYPLNATADPDTEFNNLRALTTEYISWSWAHIEGNPILYSINAHTDIRIIMAMVSIYRSPPSEGPAKLIEDTNRRLSSYFGDLSLADYIQLSAAIATILRDASLQENLNITAPLKFKYCDFFVSFLRLGTPTADLERAMALTNDSGGQLNGVHLIYGPHPECFDQRSPALIRIPEKLTTPSTQAKKLYEDIALLCR